MGEAEGADRRLREYHQILEEARRAWRDEPVDYILHLGLPKDVSLKLAKRLREAKSFISSAHTIIDNAERMDKEGYDVPELLVLKWLLDGCLQLIHIILSRLSE